MKACVLEAKNNVTYKEIPTPTPKENEVLIKIGACGICSSDFDRVYGDSAYFYPLVLGHEFAGEVVECGELTDKSLLGKKVVIFPLLPCNKCEFCKEKHYAQCTNYSYFGSRQNGAMAEYICVPTWNIKTIPDDLPFEIAAMCEPAAVAMHTIEKIKDLKNKTLCISGSGAIGIFCAIAAKNKGGEISFLIRNNSKKEFLESLGFTKFIMENSEQEQTFDYLIECVGTNASLTNCIKHIKSKGTIIIVGNPKSDIEIPKKLYWKLLRSEITLLGVWNSDYKNNENDDWDKAINFLYTNKQTVNKLITDKFNLTDGLKAFETMKHNNRITIKGVFINE